MKTKVENCCKFQEFKAFVENKKGKKIKMLRSDHGGEYTSEEFDTFCREAWIKRKLAVSYNLHQNGVAESKNRYIKVH